MTGAVGATWHSAWREAIANRAGFWVQVAIMVVNDLVWIAFWYLLFERVDDLRGWDFDRVVTLYAIFYTSGGVVLGLFSNVRRVGELATTGGLDATLALPTPTLAHLLVRRIEPINVGDIIIGIVIFVVLGSPTITTAAIFVFGVAFSVLVWGGFLLITGSLAFFAGRDEAGELGFHAITMFSAYPIDLFAGGLRFVLYGVIPAAFVTSVPARLVDDFSLPWALGLVGVGLLVATIAVLVFEAGLRRYTSGAVWTRA